MNDGVRADVHVPPGSRYPSTPKLPAGASVPDTAIPLVPALVDDSVDDVAEDDGFDGLSPRRTCVWFHPEDPPRVDRLCAVKHTEP